VNERKRGRPQSTSERDRFTYEVVRWVMGHGLKLGLARKVSDEPREPTACEVAAWLLCPNGTPPPRAWVRKTIIEVIPISDQLQEIWRSWVVNIRWFRYLYEQLELPAKHWPASHPEALNLKVSESTLRRAYQKWQGLDHSTHAYKRTCRHCGHESEFRPTRQERMESQRDRDTCKSCGGSLRNLGGDISSTR